MVKYLALILPVLLIVFGGMMILKYMKNKKECTIPAQAVVIAVDESVTYDRFPVEQNEVKARQRGHN